MKLIKTFSAATYQWAYAVVLFIAIACLYLPFLPQSISDPAKTIAIVMSLPFLILLKPIFKAMLRGGIKGYQNNQAWRNRY